MCWTYFHCFRYVSPNWKSPHGNGMLPRISNRWLGVKTRSSLMSSLDLVIGRLLIIDSTSHKTVCNTSSVIRGLEVNNANSTLRIVRIILSQTSPWCDASGGLNDQSMPFLRATCTTLDESIWRNERDSSVRAPTKFVPWSDHNFSGFPRLAMNRMKPLMNVSVSSEGSTSMWTARVL